MGEIKWLATDFQQERKWKIANAKKISRAVLKYHQKKAEMKKREERNAYVAKRKLASKIAKIVKDNFWSSMNKVIFIKTYCSVFIFVFL